MSRVNNIKKVQVSLELTLPAECPVVERWTLDQRYSLALHHLLQANLNERLAASIDSYLQGDVPQQNNHLELRQLGDSHELSEPR